MNSSSSFSDRVGHQSPALSSFADASLAGRLEGTTTAPAPPAVPARPPTGWRRTFVSLHNRDYLYLWLGFLLAWSGLSMQMLARGFLAYDITGSAGILGLITAAGAGSMAALSLFGGAIADRTNRKRLIQGFQAASVVLALAVGLLIATDRIVWWHLLIASVVQGGLFAFMAPARQAIIPELVPKEQVNNAIALNAAAMSLTSLLGPAVAGVVYALAGPATVYYLVASCSAGALLLAGRLPDSDAHKSAEARPTSKIVGEIKAGLLYTWRSPLVLVLLVASITTAILAAPFQFLMPALVVDVYGRGPEAMGILAAATGIGALVGSLMVASTEFRRRGLLMIGASLVTGVSLLLVAALPFFVVALVLMIPFGLGATARMTINQALVIEAVGAQYRGRVMGIFMLSWGLMPISVLPAGLLTDWAGVRVALGVLAALLIGVTVVIFVTQKRLREVQ